MSKLIPLRNRKGDVVAHAIVDDADFDWLSQYRWFRSARSVATSIKSKSIEMHAMIMSPPAGLEVDHKDTNTLNNQRDNLRICTHAQNLANRRKFKNGKTSQYKGVYKPINCTKRPWRASIAVNRKVIVLGFFTSELDAALAYNAAAIEHFGDFARLNEV